MERAPSASDQIGRLIPRRAQPNVFRWLLAAVVIVGFAAGGVGAGTRYVSRMAEANSARVTLDVQHLRQESLLCVPTSAAMILAFYDDPRPPRLLKTLAAGKTYDPAAPFNDFSITLFRDLVRAVRQLGYSWAEQTFADTPEGFAQGIQGIEAEIRRGHPVMVDITLRPQMGHTFVIAGIDARARTLFIVDPDSPAPGRRMLSYDQFAQVWNEHAYGGGFRSAVFTRPKSRPV